RVYEVDSRRDRPVPVPRAMPRARVQLLRYRLRVVSRTGLGDAPAVVRGRRDGRGLPETRAAAFGGMLQVPAIRRREVTVARRTPKKILVYGSREFGQVVRDLAVQCGYAFAGFIDDVNHGEGILGAWQEVARSHGSSSHAVAMAIGYRHLRERREICAL